MNIKQLFSGLFCPSWTILSERYFVHREKYLKNHSWWHLFKCKKIAHKSCASLPVSEIINRFKTPHGLLGIVIHKDVSLGTDCTIFQFVTIGKIEDSSSKHFGVPKIGNNVFIGAGATIIGGVTVGDNVKIGAGCTVTCDVPANATVVTQKPRVLLKKAGKN